MRKLVAIFALLTAAAVPSAASAQFFLGARLGYSMPFGDAEKDVAMKDGLKSEIPIQIDLGLKLGQALAVGVYGSYAFGQPGGTYKTFCDGPGADCKVSDLRLGAQVNIHAANTSATEFWGGLALGYARATQDDVSGKSFNTGIEAAVQGGFDFLASPAFRVGPFASLSVGQYTNWDDGVNSGRIADKTLHGFFTIGVRGLFGS